MTTYLSEYAYFTNKNDMDEAAKQHVAANWNELNTTERTVLDLIRRYSVKYGAAHLKHETIEKAVKKSNATVRRAIRKLGSSASSNGFTSSVPCDERTRRQYLRYFTLP